MPIGSELNETLPAVGDSPSVAASRIIDTFQKLVAAVEGKVNTSVIQANANLDMLGYQVQRVGTVAFENQAGAPATSGYLARYNNDLWWVHPSGAFKITDGVHLNATAIGGFSGDFGLGTEKVEYDATLDRYEFYDAPGDFSGVMGDRMIIMGSGGGECTLDSTATTAVGWTFPDTPAAAGLMQADTSANITVSPTVAYKLTLSVLPATPDDEVMQCIQTAVASSGSITKSNTGIAVGGGGATFAVDISGIPVGNRIKALKADVLKSTGGTATIRLRKRTVSGGVAGLTTIGTDGTTTDSGASAVPLDKSGLTEVVTTRASYIAEIILPASGDTLVGFCVIHDRT